MKRIIKTTLLASGLALLAGLAGIAPAVKPLTELKAMQASPPHIVTLDLAVDCRTAAGEFTRGGIFMLNGKIFPAGTLPSGAASNDPAQPVNGVAPIGDWLVRGQHALPLPPALAPFYSSAPGDFATGYFILDRGQSALFTEAYAFLQDQAPSLAFNAVTGGVGRFRGAAGDNQGGPIGFNVTGCPNFRLTFNLVPGSVRGN
jgi:hypothetical protein